MISLESTTTTDELFAKAMESILTDLGPERAFILYGHNQNGTWKTQASHGLDGDRVLVSGEISLQPLRHVLADGEPVMLLDAREDPEYSGRMSVNLSGVRSVICVAWKDRSDQVAGLVYADDRVRRSAFLEDNLAWMLGLADRIRRQLDVLAGVAPLPPAEDGPPSGEEGPPSEDSTGGADSSSDWDTFRRLGHKLLKIGQVGKAERQLKSALKAARKTGEDSLAEAKTLRSMAKVYRVQHRLDECREVLERAAEIFEKRGRPLDVARCLNTLAGGYFTDSQWDKAEGLYRRAVELWMAEDPYHKMLSPALTHLGDIQSRRAETYYLRANEVAAKSLGEEHPITRKTRDRLGNVQAKLTD
ncbi:MAG: tetratricopeptide repeat protein [Candidatus Eremiobacteraeota bacterium]|nr:tetratricopeptide repeat protein [Candidatus Eremiobacteraeota bacterium]